jgi:hypothetical protein
LTDSPSLPSSSPYDDGWIVAIRPQDDTGKYSLSGEEAQRRSEREMEKLRSEFRSAMTNASEEAGATMHDGGLRLDSLQGIVGSQKYFSLISNLFSLR